MNTAKNAFYPAVKRYFTLFAAGYKHIFGDLGIEDFCFNILIIKPL